MCDVSYTSHITVHVASAAHTYRPAHYIIQGQFHPVTSATLSGAPTANPTLSLQRHSVVPIQPIPPCHFSDTQWCPYSQSHPVTSATLSGAHTANPTLSLRRHSVVPIQPIPPCHFGNTQWCPYSQSHPVTSATLSGAPTANPTLSLRQHSVVPIQPIPPCHFGNTQWCPYSQSHPVTSATLSGAHTANPTLSLQRHSVVPYLVQVACCSPQSCDQLGQHIVAGTVELSLQTLSLVLCQLSLQTQRQKVHRACKHVTRCNTQKQVVYKCTPSASPSTHWQHLRGPATCVLLAVSLTLHDWGSSWLSAARSTGQPGPAKLRIRMEQRTLPRPLQHQTFNYISPKYMLTVHICTYIHDIYAHTTKQ